MVTNDDGSRREHAQEPAEGADDSADVQEAAGAPEAREHPDEPAEGSED